MRDSEPPLLRAASLWSKYTNSSSRLLRILAALIVGSLLTQNEPGAASGECTHSHRLTCLVLQRG